MGLIIAPNAQLDPKLPLHLLILVSFVLQEPMKRIELIALHVLQEPLLREDRVDQAIVPNVQQDP